MIGWKVLRADGRSLNGLHNYDLTGAWKTVPGNGAYVAFDGELLSGGYGELLAEIETPDDEPNVIKSHVPGVRCRRTVRVSRTWHAGSLSARDWAELLEVPVVRCWIAQNPAIPADAAAVLARDANDDVRSYLARNPAIPADAADVLAK